MEWAQDLPPRVTVLLDEQTTVRVRNDVSPKLVKSICSKQTSYGCKLVDPCQLSAVVSLSDTTIRTPPDLSACTAPLHPELTP